ncbi:MAG: hypothetical protein ABIL01_30140 [Pseudomonadota bacterium]
MLHDIGEFVHPFIWPGTVLIVLYFLRAEVKNLAGKLTESVDRAVGIKVGTKGVEIKLRESIAAANARVTALQAVHEQMTPPAARSRGRRKTAAATTGKELPAELLDLAQAYLKTEISDHAERVRFKNENAREMGDIVLANDVSHDLLVQDDNEALYVAFAAAVVARPEQADLGRLLGVARKVARLHVRYRLVVALIVLINKGFARETDSASIQDALNRFRVNADAPLLTVINDAESLLKAIISGEIATDV